MSKTAHSTNISDSFCQKSHGASESRTWRFCPGAFPLTKGLETPNRAYRLHAIVRKIVVYSIAARSALPSPLGKVPQCAHWGGRGFRSGTTINTLEYMEKLRNAGFYQLQSEYLPCTKPLQSPKSVPKCRFGCQLPQRGSQGRCRASAVNNNLLFSVLTMASGWGIMISTNEQVLIRRND